MFPGKYHQNAGFNISILVYGSLRGEVSKGNWHHQSSPYILVAVLDKPFELQVGRFIVSRDRGISKWPESQNVELWWNHTLFVQCPKLSEYLILGGGFNFQPIWKVLYSQINQFPNFAVETKNTSKPPRSYIFVEYLRPQQQKAATVSLLKWLFGFHEKSPTVSTLVHCTPQEINGFFT